jgi:hypothetical protein
VCTATSNDNANCGGCGIACGANRRCVGVQCVCALGLTLCNGACLNLQTDRTNCGTCGHLCQGQKQCVTGLCQ